MRDADRPAARGLAAPRTSPDKATLSPWATGLGYLALLPFVVGAGAVWMADSAIRPVALQAMSAYAAVVISFIGAIHWGIAFTQPTPARSLFVWGVMPSIVAFGALMVTPPIGLAIHAAMLAACFAVDRTVYRRERVARWLPLRLRLTTVAILCCLFAIGA